MSHPNTAIIGIDCAVSEKNIGLACGIYGQPSSLQYLVPGKKDHVIPQIVEWCQQSDAALLTMDAPLGWPVNMGDELTHHEAGQPIKTKRNEFFNRETDKAIHRRYGKKPLEVGSNLIARTAHAALEMLDTLRDELHHDIPVRWSPSFRRGEFGAIEVYPAATVIAHGLGKGNYHSDKNLDRRDHIMRYLQKTLNFECEDEVLRTNPHVLDAALCVLAGQDFLDGTVVPPIHHEPVQQEVWIWVKKMEDSLSVY